MLRRLLPMLLLLALGACARSTVPIPSVDRALPPPALGLAPERIEALIVEAGRRADWRMERIAPGHLVATLTGRERMAAVDIHHDASRYRITYRDSSGIDAADGQIHPRFVTWIQRLDAAIYRRLVRPG